MEGSNRLRKILGGMLLLLVIGYAIFTGVNLS